MLYSILKQCELTMRNGQKIGNITNLLVNTRETPWTVKEIIFKMRVLGRKTFTFPIDRVGKINKTQKTVLVIDYVEPEPSPTLPEVDVTSLTGLTKKTAVSEDGENIGKVSDFDISTLTKPWTVEKVMIKPGTGKRRLRISVDRVKQVEKNVIIKAK